MADLFDQYQALMERAAPPAKSAAQIIAEAVFPATFSSSPKVAEMAACGDTVEHARAMKLMVAELAVTGLRNAGLLK